MAKFLDAQTIIVHALEEYGGNQKHTADHTMVCCPFHSDRSPSCGIFLGEGLEIPLGMFHCFGCGEKGHWNRFAQQANLPQIKSWERFNSVAAYKDVEDEIENIDELTKSIRAQYTHWPNTMQWRGYEGKLIKKVGGLLLNDVKSNNIMLLFPISVNGKLRGGIKAYIEKPAFGLSYISTQGSWVKKYGLFPYEHVKSMMKTHDALALVEGPRDALRLVSNGIPALAVLGAQNFGKEKALIVSGLFPERVYAIPDNDEAGAIFGNNVKKYMSRYCDAYNISLGKGDKKVDPDNANQKIIDRIKRIIVPDDDV